MVKQFPGLLRTGDKFRVRATTNSRIYVVKGLPLKVSPENGFKWGTRPGWEYGKILVPVENHTAGELLLDKDVAVYVLE